MSNESKLNDLSGRQVTVRMASGGVTFIVDGYLKQSHGKWVVFTPRGLGDTPSCWFDADDVVSIGNANSRNRVDIVLGPNRQQLRSYL